MKEIILSGKYKYYMENEKAIIFKYLSDEKTIYVPEKIDNIEVAGIGKQAYSKKAAENIIIGNNIKFIEEKAFEGCASIKSINLPESLERIGMLAFSKCLSLESINIKNKHFVSENGVLYNYDKSIIIECPLKKSGAFYVADTVKEIGKGCFCGCSINEIIFGRNTEIINDYAFEGCKEIKSISLPESVRFIGIRAFAETNIETAHIYADKIRYYAFFKSKLRKIVFNKECDIDEFAFMYCDNISEVDVGKDINIISSFSNGMDIIINGIKIKFPKYYILNFEKFNDDGFDINKYDAFFEKALKYISNYEAVHTALYRILYPEKLTAERKSVYMKYIIERRPDLSKYISKEYITCENAADFMKILNLTQTSTENMNKFMALTKEKTKRKFELKT